MTDTTATQKLSPCTQTGWRCLAALDTGGRGVRADVLMSAQRAVPDDLVALEEAGLIKAKIDDGGPHSRINLADVMDGWVKAMGHAIRISLTRYGARMAHSPESLIRRSFKSPAERVPVSLLRNRTKVSRHMVRAAQTSGQIEILYCGEPNPYDESMWSIANDRLLDVELTKWARKCLPLGGFR